MSDKVINQAEAYISYYMFISILSISNLHRNLPFSTLYAHIINNLNKFHRYLKNFPKPQISWKYENNNPGTENHVGNPRSGVNTPALAALAELQVSRLAGYRETDGGICHIQNSGLNLCKVGGVSHVICCCRQQNPTVAPSLWCLMLFQTNHSNLVKWNWSKNKSVMKNIL